MAKRDNRLAARALADWAREGFSRSTEGQIADTYGIATRTLWRWKDALDSDSELSALFRERVNDFLDRDWADELDDALRETIQELILHIKSQPMFSPESIEAITKAFSALGEVAIAREVLGVAATEQDAAARAPTAADGRGEATSLPN